MVLLLFAGLASAGDVRIVKRAHALMPREGQAINALITKPDKKGYHSAVNLNFDERKRLAASRTGVDTIKVLAIRVDFQEDSTPLTTGNGKMDYAGFLDPIAGLLFDPPHTRGYFEHLMDALNNYYALNSLGKLLHPVPRGARRADRRLPTAAQHDLLRRHD